MSPVKGSVAELFSRWGFEIDYDLVNERYYTQTCRVHCQHKENLSHEEALSTLVISPQGFDCNALEAVWDLVTEASLVTTADDISRASFRSVSPPSDFSFLKTHPQGKTFDEVRTAKLKELIRLNPAEAHRRLAEYASRGGKTSLYPEVDEERMVYVKVDPSDIGFPSILIQTLYGTISDEVFKIPLKLLSIISLETSTYRDFPWIGKVKKSHPGRKWVKVLGKVLVTSETQVIPQDDNAFLETFGVFSETMSLRQAARSARVI